MTVEKLIEELKKHPGHMEVYIHESAWCGDFSFWAFDEVRKVKVALSEEPGESPMAHEDAVAIGSIGSW